MDMMQARSRLLDRIEQCGGERITGVMLDDVFDAAEPIRGDDAERLAAVGVVVEGDKNLTVLASNAGQSFGSIHIANSAPGAVVLLGAYSAGSPSLINLRLVAPDAILAIPDMTAPGQTFYLPNVLLRSPNQILYWGAGSSAVMAQLELEGDGTAMLIGDDAMLSNDIWIRNHDMHTMFDTRTGAISNATRGDIVLEQHVWLGQGALILGPRRVGFGSVISARSLVNADVVAESLMVGSPARQLRGDVGWSRDPCAVSDATVSRLTALRLTQAFSQRSQE